MKLYNTMTRQIEEVKPLKKGQVSMYTCGPTVYLDPHIGNWRTFINYDLLARVLKQNGFTVKQVLNITDVGHLVGDGDEGEDKLAKTAKSQRKTAWDVAKHYTEVFKSGLKDLNILQPAHMPKATDYIEQQINMVKTLEERGVTYKIDDGIYFDTSKVEGYGKLARLDLEGQQAGARVEENDQKRQPQDFALWKFSPKSQKRDMEWDSPWGKGFPGWHIECSVMALDLLGPTIDIHGGGIDHIPVHHTNEIAQSETVNQAEFSKVWFHSAFMKVDGTKMSKSLGNVYTLSDLIGKGYSPQEFRFLILQSHYRTESNFTWETLDAASHRLKDLYTVADLCYQADDSSKVNIDFDDVIERFKTALSDDLNTPKALEILSEVISAFDNTAPTSELQTGLQEFIKVIDDSLGLQLTGDDITDNQRQIILARQKAREEKDWATADKLRDELLEQGIELNDTASSTLWARRR